MDIYSLIISFEFPAIMQAEERKKQKEHMKVLKQQVFIHCIYFLNTSYWSIVNKNPGQN